LTLTVISLQSLAAILLLVIKIAKWAKAKMAKSTTRVEPAETPVTLTFSRKNLSLEEDIVKHSFIGRRKSKNSTSKQIDDIN